MASRSPDPGGVYWNMLKHAALAAVFFFVLQHFALKESLGTSLLWAGFFAAAAAGLAWAQGRRGL